MHTNLNRFEVFRSYANGSITEVIFNIFQRNTKSIVNKPVITFLEPDSKLKKIVSS